jgi:G:T-mismatch repair DNA endonuclease (very short patch repair protein)
MAEVTTGAGERDRSEQQEWLSALSDSGLERRFIDWLQENGHRLPDDAQQTVSAAGARPDFVYNLPGSPVAVFVDGPHHDEPVQRLRDEQAAERLEDLGWAVVRVHHSDDWPALVGRHAWIFGPGRTAR